MFEVHRSWDGSGAVRITPVLLSTKSNFNYGKQNSNKKSKSKKYLIKKKANSDLPIKCVSNLINF